MKTLNLNKLTILLGLFLVSVLFTTSTYAECATTGTKITIDTSDAAEPVNNQDGEGLGDSCEQTPDSYKMTFYKIGLCTADTSFNDLSSCQYIVNDAAGVTHNVEYPSVGEMAIPKFAIDNGTYPYLVVVMTNKLGIKHSFEATNNVIGRSATGKFCWTDGVSNPGTYNNASVMTYSGHSVNSVAGGAKTLECGTSAGTADFNYEIINVFNRANNNWCYTDGDDATSGTSNFASNGDRTPMGLMGNGEATVSLLQSDDTYATTCQNGAKILWTTLLTTPYVVTDESTFSLNIKTVEGVSIDFDGGGSSATVLKVGANPPQLNLVVTN
ncbi:hypothetical protein N9E74_00275 [Candidatus Pseudothioglobus singularis]|nr:hypothetical protein [Candidatus Pseudothioglobus singularis]